jgi:hypothetical protein
MEQKITCEKIDNAHNKEEGEFASNDKRNFIDTSARVKR